MGIDKDGRADDETPTAGTSRCNMGADGVQFLLVVDRMYLFRACLADFLDETVVPAINLCTGLKGGQSFLRTKLQLNVKVAMLRNWRENEALLTDAIKWETTGSLYCHGQRGFVNDSFLQAFLVEPSLIWVTVIHFHALLLSFVIPPWPLGYREHTISLFTKMFVLHGFQRSRLTTRSLKVLDFLES